MLSLFLVWLQTMSLLHPFHVSVCDVELNIEAKAIQISQRIFLDDLELALNNRYLTNLIIDDLSRQVERDSLINLYLKEHLKILVDGKHKEGNYLGSEFEEDAIWCYFEIEGIKRVKQIEVVSTVLYNEFDDQANIIHFKNDAFEKSVKLDEKKAMAIFAIPKI